MSRIPIDEIREQYEEKLWRALDGAVQFSAVGMTHLADGESMRLGGLLNDIAMKGWAVRLATGPNGTAAMHFYPRQDGETNDGKDKSLVSLTDRELLVKLSDMVSEYDRRRDDELEFLDAHPNRDVWDDETNAAYREICEDIRAKYAKIAKVLDHVDTKRRGLEVKA